MRDVLLLLFVAILLIFMLQETLVEGISDFEPLIHEPSALSH